MPLYIFHIIIHGWKLSGQPSCITWKYFFPKGRKVHESNILLPEIKIQPSQQGLLSEVPFFYSHATFSSSINIDGNCTQLSRKKRLRLSMLPAIISGNIRGLFSFSMISLFLSESWLFNCICWLISENMKKLKFRIGLQKGSCSVKH